MSYNELIDKVHSYLSLLKEEGETQIEISKPRSRTRPAPAVSTPATPNLSRPATPAKAAATPSEEPHAPAQPLALRIAHRVDECGGPQDSTRLIWIGEGTEFDGANGEMLNKMLYAMGYTLSDDALQWVSETDTPAEAAAVLTLGQVALDRAAGKRRSLTMTFGKPQPTAGGRRFVPCFAPSYLRQNPSAKKAVWKEMLALLQRENLELPPWSQKFKKG